MPVTDVHEASQCAEVAQAVDVPDPGVPVPADRSLAGGGRDRQGRQRQERSVSGAVGHGKRRCQITGAGNRNVLVTERGASFGYNTLVSDMRALPILRAPPARR